MKEYVVRYLLNEVEGTYFVTVSKVKIPFIFIRPSIIHQLKMYLHLEPNDKLKILEIRENK